MANLICPKCRADMASYERNGVTVDQCTECRGLFLDRGELDHLIAAESAWAAAPATQPASYQGSQPAQSYPPQGYQQSDQNQSYNPRYDKKHKKRSFFEDLFD